MDEIPSATPGPELAPQPSLDNVEPGLPASELAASELTASQDLRLRALGSFELRHGEATRALPASPEAQVELLYQVWHRKSMAEDLAQGSSWFAGEGLEGLWLDVEAFEALGRRGLDARSADPRDLAEAAGLYRGDLLEGVELEPTAGHAGWLDDQRRRLRGLALEVLDALVASYLARGEVRLGTRWARRLVALDPLREEGHRFLIRLYGDTGRRRQAQTQFDTLRRLLAERLGCAPSKETRRVLAQALEWGDPSDTFLGEPVGPVLPLVGRADAYRQLETDGRQAAQGCRLSLVSGEAGVGKTRLVRTVLDGLSARQRLPILLGRCDGLVRQPFRVLRELVEAGLVAREDALEALWRAVEPEALVEVARLVPAVADSVAQRLDPVPAAVGGERLFQALAQVLTVLAGEATEPATTELAATETATTELAATETATTEPAERETAAESLPTESLPDVVLFFDDLHVSEGETWELVRYLLHHADTARWWIVATCPGPVAEVLVQDLPGEAAERVSHIELERVSGEAVEEIARSLVEGEEVDVLQGFLAERGSGLPVAMAEWINYLWDDRALLQDADHWRLEKPVEGLQAPPDESLEGLIWRRFQRLPSSARRLAVLAAVIGHQVDRDLLEKIEEEHRAVVELGLQVLVERWILQRRSRRWSTSHEEADDEGQPIYEFSHRRIRQAIYHSLVPERRRALHATVAHMLVAQHQDIDDRRCEELAHHFRAAGLWSEAYPYLRRSARKAAALLARDTAVHYFERTLEAIERCAALAEGEEARRWATRRRRVDEERQEFERQTPP